MKPIFAVITFLLLSPCVWARSPKELTRQMSDRIIRQILITPDGKGLQFNVLEELALKLSQINKKAGDFREQHHEHPSVGISLTPDPPSESTALNEFLIFGNMQSTSPTHSLSAACDLCASAMDIAGKFLVGNEENWASLMSLVKRVCPGNTGMSQTACDGFTDLYFRDIGFYISETLFSAPYTLCQLTYANLGCGKPDHPHFLWEIALPDRLPEGYQPVQRRRSAKEKVNVLMISDIHMDPEYVVGSPAVCRETMCCRSTSTPVHDPVPEGEKAGYWGDYRKCDLPHWAFEDLLREINTTHAADVDIVFVAGDLPPHDNWNQTAEHHCEIIELVAGKMAEKLPGKPVFFAVGNHEIVPTNMYPLEGDPQEFSAQWLYDELANVWMKWLDPAIAEATVRKAGFYTTELMPGWRLITINDNYCLEIDFFMLGRANITDPYGVLQWMVDLLTESERKGERVQILGHVPPGHPQCLQAWSWNYYRIVSRFSHIITGQFFGHRHKDYISMYYDAETLSIPKGVGFVGPPATPFSRNNIGYRLYEFDANTLDLLDSFTYYVDIAEANEIGDTTKMPWKLEYSARAAYGLEDMTAASWDKFMKAMQTNDTLFTIYQNHYTLSLKDVGDPCGLECRRTRLCEAYHGLGGATSASFCEHFFPTSEMLLEEEEAKYRKCSPRFVKRVQASR